MAAGHPAPAFSAVYCHRLPLPAGAATAAAAAGGSLVQTPALRQVRPAGPAPGAAGQAGGGGAGAARPDRRVSRRVLPGGCRCTVLHSSGSASRLGCALVSVVCCVPRRVLPWKRLPAALRCSAGVAAATQQCALPRGGDCFEREGRPAGSKAQHAPSCHRRALPSAVL